MFVALVLSLVASGPNETESPVQRAELPPEVASFFKSWETGTLEGSEALLEWTVQADTETVDSVFHALDDPGHRDSAVSVGRALGAVPSFAVSSLRSSELRAPAIRVAALNILRHTAGIDELGTCFALALEEEEGSTAVLDALEAGLDGIFARNAHSIGRASTHIGGIDDFQKLRLIRSLGRHPVVGSFDVLGKLLGEDERFASMILSQIGRIANQNRPLGASLAGGHIRRLLESPTPRVRREAALALGKLQDTDSFEAIIEALDDSDARVAANAHWSLTAISSRNFRPEKRHWAAWYNAELTWWRGRGLQLLGDLQSQQPGSIASALNELSQHRLFRHAIAEELRGLIGARRNEIARLACTALVTLRSSVALPELVQALEHPDPRIREAAQRALRETTGLSLGPDGTCWQKALEGSW